MTTIVPTPGIAAVSPALKVTITLLIVVLNVLTTKLFPSASVSFDNTSPVNGMSSVTFTSSSVAPGGSLVGVITIDRVPESVAPTVSVAVYSIAGTVPI